MPKMTLRRPGTHVLGGMTTDPAGNVRSRPDECAGGDAPLPQKVKNEGRTPLDRIRRSSSYGPRGHGAPQLGIRLLVAFSLLLVASYFPTRARAREAELLPPPAVRVTAKPVAVLLPPPAARVSPEPIAPPAPSPLDGIEHAAAAIRRCESEDRNVKNPESSASGYYQFLDSTWRWVTGLPAPAMAHPREVQDAAFAKLWDGGRGASHWRPSRYCWGKNVRLSS